MIYRVRPSSRQQSTSLLSDWMLYAGSLHTLPHYFVGLSKNLRTLHWAASASQGTLTQTFYQGSLPGRRAWLDCSLSLPLWLGALVQGTTCIAVQGVPSPLCPSPPVSIEMVISHIPFCFPQSIFSRSWIILCTLLSNFNPRATRKGRSVDTNDLHYREESQLLGSVS